MRPQGASVALTGAAISRIIDRGCRMTQMAEPFKGSPKKWGKALNPDYADEPVAYLVETASQILKRRAEDERNMLTAPNNEQISKS